MVPSSPSTSAAPYEEERETICHYGMELINQNLTKSTGGNLSIRGENDEYVISPTAIPYREMKPADVPVVDGDGSVVYGDKEPATETPMHLTIFQHLSEVGGIVHTHSPYACTFASLARPIPASHYLIAFAGNEIPVTDYQTYGTPELGQEAVDTLGKDYKACLLQSHGVITVGSDLAEAFEIAMMVEFCARIHYQACSIGDPVILPDDELEKLKKKFATYGQSGATGDH